MKSGNATIILLIVALVVGIASTILIITVARSSPSPTTTKASDAKSLFPSLSPSTASAQAKFTVTDSAPVSSSSATTTTTAIATVTNLTPGDINTTTALSTDKTTFLIDFIALSFQPISLINYTINYTADASGSATAKSIKGSFAPASVLITGYKTNGYPYIRKSFTLGTCSGTACTYDTNPRTFSVTISAKLIGS